MRYQFCNLSQQLEMLPNVKKGFLTTQERHFGRDTQVAQQIMLHKGRPRLTHPFPKTLLFWISNPTSLGVWTGPGAQTFPRLCCTAGPKTQAGTEAWDRVKPHHTFYELQCLGGISFKERQRQR